MGGNAVGARHPFGRGQSGVSLIEVKGKVNRKVFQISVPSGRLLPPGITITVDGVEMGDARERDRAGRDLPVWEGCRRIPTGEVFLMNWQVPDSLDGRYFGLTSTNQIIGRAAPLWTDEEGNGRFEWRAPTR